MIDDPYFYVLAIPALLMAGINKTGFASGLGVLAVPLMSLAIPPLQAVAILLVVYCVMDLFAMWAYRRSWDRTNLRIILPAGFVGIGVGWLSAGMLSTPAIKMIVGAIAMLFTLHHWLGPRAVVARSPKRIKGYVCSAVAGYASFLAHAGGPPLSMYLLPQRMEPARYVGTAAMYWGVMNYAKLLPFGALGQLDSRNLLTALVLLPLAPIGTRLGVWINRAIDPVWFYRIVYALTFAIGAKLVWDGLQTVIA